MSALFFDATCRVEEGGVKPPQSKILRKELKLTELRFGFNLMRLHAIKPRSAGRAGVVQQNDPVCARGRRANVNPR